MVWKMFRINRKTLARRKSIVVALVRFELSLHLVWVLSWLFFEKQANVQCVIGSISMLISSHIHNAANRAIMQPTSKNSWQSNFKRFKVLFSRIHQGSIRAGWTMYSCIFYVLCFMVTVFQVDTLLSILWTIPSLSQLKQKSHYWFSEPRLVLNRAYFLSHVFCNSAVDIIHLL